MELLPLSKGSSSPYLKEFLPLSKGSCSSPYSKEFLPNSYPKGAPPLIRRSSSLIQRELLLLYISKREALTKGVPPHHIFLQHYFSPIHQMMMHRACTAWLNHTLHDGACVAPMCPAVHVVGVVLISQIASVMLCTMATALY